MARHLQEPGTEEGPEGERQQDHHDRPAHELGHRELPADQQSQDDAQLDHQVRRGDPRMPSKR